MANLNEEFDRGYNATCRVAEGTLPFQKVFPIEQLGLREPFAPSNDDDGIIGADNQEFGVLKQT